jgi:hypothetical protein
MARRAALIGGYLACVFGAAAIAIAIDLHRERAEWTRDLDSANPERRSEALARYSLTLAPWPEPVPCRRIASQLGDTAVRREAVAALRRLVQSGKCICEVLDTAAADGGTAMQAAAVVLDGIESRSAAPEGQAKGTDPHSCVHTSQVEGRINDAAQQIR